MSDLRQERQEQLLNALDQFDRAALLEAINRLTDAVKQNTAELQQNNRVTVTNNDALETLTGALNRFAAPDLMDEARPRSPYED